VYIKKYENLPFTLILIPLLFSCKQTVDIDAARNEILQAEKAFEKMASEKGQSAAFYYFAAENAVIRRGNDSLIFGKESIKNYYDKNANPNAKLNWTPDFIGVSDCGTLGYTYGNMYSRFRTLPVRRSNIQVYSILSGKNKITTGDMSGTNYAM
jgi:hypothetical protein